MPMKDILPHLDKKEKKKIKYSMITMMCCSVSRQEAPSIKIESKKKLSYEVNLTLYLMYIHAK